MEKCMKSATPVCMGGLQRPQRQVPAAPTAWHFRPEFSGFLFQHTKTRWWFFLQLILWLFLCVFFLALGTMGADGVFWSLLAHQFQDGLTLLMVGIGSRSQGKITHLQNGIPVKTKILLPHNGFQYFTQYAGSPRHFTALSLWLPSAEIPPHTVQELQAYHKRVVRTNLLQYMQQSSKIKLVLFPYSWV